MPQFAPAGQRYSVCVITFCSWVTFTPCVDDVMLIAATSASEKFEAHGNAISGQLNGAFVFAQETVGYDPARAGMVFAAAVDGIGVPEFQFEDERPMSALL